MNDLIKIGEMSARYDISARTLRYYEEMGLLTSTRSDDYAYRMYDDEALKRLEQILILRKLNISIKDIKRIFDTAGSEVVLEVLGKKVDNIDDEVALLNELKSIVLDFIEQIKASDFGSSDDVKQLYEKASEIETHLTNVDYEGNTSKINRLLDITAKLKKAPEVRVLRANPFRAVTSGIISTDILFGAFDKWVNEHRHLLKTNLYGSGLTWINVGKDGRHYGKMIYAVEDGISDVDVAPYKLFDYTGGLYAVAVSIDEDQESLLGVYNMILKWIDNSNFEYEARHECEMLMTMLNPDDEIKQALGYHQLEVHVPIKVKK